MKDQTTSSDGSRGKDQPIKANHLVSRLARVQTTCVTRVPFNQTRPPHTTIIKTICDQNLSIIAGKIEPFLNHVFHSAESIILVKVRELFWLSLMQNLLPNYDWSIGFFPCYHTNNRLMTMVIYTVFTHFSTACYLPGYWRLRNPKKCGCPNTDVEKNFFDVSDAKICFL